MSERTRAPSCCQNQNVYGKSWWDERVDAVTRAVEAVMKEEEKESGSGSGKESKQLEPFLEPQTV
jgi:hypothetical protein